MAETRAEVREWLRREFAARVGALASSPQAPGAQTKCWRLAFQNVPGAMFLALNQDAIPQPVRDILPEFAQTVGARLRREVSLVPEEAVAIASRDWTWVDVLTTDEPCRIAVAFDEMLFDAFQPSPQAPAIAPVEPAPSAQPPSKTFDLLLEVEMPVSISFGRTQVPLKDVLKLTVGSIVELNRTIADPVEVIVNNCVIARGEVVVVEGNFGVRVRNVISRQERLRTLD